MFFVAYLTPFFLGSGFDGSQSSVSTPDCVCFRCPVCTTHRATSRADLPVISDRKSTRTRLCFKAKNNV